MRIKNVIFKEDLNIKGNITGWCVEAKNIKADEIRCLDIKASKIVAKKISELDEYRNPPDITCDILKAEKVTCGTLKANEIYVSHLKGKEIKCIEFFEKLKNGRIKIDIMEVSQINNVYIWNDELREQLERYFTYKGIYNFLRRKR